MFCKNCGNELKEAAKFCDKCGSKIENEQKKETHKKKGFLESLGIENNITLTSKKPLKISHLIIIIFLFILFLGFIMTLSVDVDPNYKSTTQLKNEEILAQYSIPYEYTDKIITACGFNDYTLEEVGEENGIYYFIIRQKDNISGGLNIKNGTVLSVDYAENILYENGQLLHNINEFILTNNEKYDYIDFAKEAVKKQLNYPNTAKFSSLYDSYSVSYTDKSKVTVKGEVTASNAFNVSTTYTFEVTFENSTVNVILY